MRYIYIIMLFSIMFIAISVDAGNISAPPPLADEPVSEQLYLRQIYDNFHNLPVVTTNPDGTRSGQKGDMLLLITGGNYYLEINIDGDTSWRGVNLTDTP